MNADDMIREAANEAAEETLSDRRINPDEEEERIVMILRNAYRSCLEAKTSDLIAGAHYNPEYCDHPGVKPESECPYCGAFIALEDEGS